MRSVIPFEVIRDIKAERLQRRLERHTRSMFKQIQDTVYLTPGL